MGMSPLSSVPFAISASTIYSPAIAAPNATSSAPSLPLASSTRVPNWPLPAAWMRRPLSSSLAESLHLASGTADDLYEAMDWLLPRQERIEEALAKRHLSDGCLVLYDVTSTYFEGHHCSLARFGHSRDERSGNPQIVCGLLTNAEGCPVAMEVFPGNTADPKTVAAQVRKLRERFGLQRLVLVGDRGMLTSARIRED